VNWDSVCLSRDEGGLGVRRLREFNISLLGKWCWRMLVDKEGLWYRVLKARYGEEGGRLKEGGRDSSLWWRLITIIRRGVGVSEGSWFEDNLCRVVGGGGNTFFWSDNWVGVCLYRSNSLAFLTWLWINGWRSSRWRVEGGPMVVVPGSGGCVSWRGRRRRCLSVHFCCIMLFCRIIFLTGGGGCLTLLMVIPLKVLILISRRQMSLPSVPVWWFMEDSSSA